MPSSKHLIKQPIISEKATDLAGLDKYVFLVEPNANKTQIKSAIEGIYKVNVEKVNVIRNRDKAHDFKKAIVTIKEGESIDVIPH